MNAKPSRKNGHARFAGKIPKSAAGKLFQNVAKSFLIVTGATLLLTVLLSLALYATADPNRYIAPMSLSILFISSLLGGFVSVKQNKSSALLCGLVYGGMLLVLTLVVSLFFDNSYSSEYSLIMSIGLRGIAVALSILGAFIGSGRKKKPSFKRKR